MGTGHRAGGAGQFPQQVLHFGPVERRVDLDGRAAGQRGRNATAQIINRDAAQFAFGDLEDLVDRALHAAGFEVRGNGLDGDGAIAEGLGLETGRGQVGGDAVVFHLLRGSQRKHDGHQQTLLLDLARGLAREVALKENALVGDMLVDDPQPV